MNRKQAVCILTATGMLLGLTQNVFAYQSDSQRAQNNVCIGHNDSHIEETFPDPDPIVPEINEVAAKRVTVKNDNTVPCFVRAAVSWSDDDIGKGAALQNMDLENWTFISAEEDQKLGGYYYYHGVLQPGEQTTALFDGVLLQGEKMDFHNQTETDSFEIILYEESVESGDQTEYRSAWDAYIRQV